MYNEMSKFNEINSTEKLLDVIRGNADPKQDNKREKASSPFSSRREELPTSPKKARQKAIVVGVEITQHFIRLVKIGRSPHESGRLLDNESIEIPQSSPAGSPQFEDLLMKSLSSFCRGTEPIDVWANIPDDQVEIRHIKIPKVPKNQIANAVYWTTQKEAPFDEKESVLDFDVLGDITDKGIPKLEVSVCIAAKKAVEKLKSLFSGIGFPLSGITIPSMAIQNIIRSHSLPDEGREIAVLTIDNEFSRIDIFSHGNLAMSRRIKTGIDSLIEAIKEEYGARENLSLDTEGGAAQMDDERAREILLNLSSDKGAGSEGKTPISVVDKDIFEMVRPAIERLMRQVKRTFEYYTINLEQKKINKIYLSGQADINKSVLLYVKQKIEVETDILDPIGTHGAALSGKPSMDDFFVRTALVPAFGLALSDNSQTINFLFTYKEEEKEKEAARVNRTIFTGFFISLLICTGIFSYQKYSTDKMERMILRLDGQLSGFSEHITQEMVSVMASEIKKKQEETKAYSSRYLGKAIFSEVSAITPRNIRIVELKTHLGKGAASPPSLTGDADKKNLHVSGVIEEERNYAEATLSEYILQLDQSALFKNVSLKKRTYEDAGKGRKLIFEIDITIG